jgi:N-acyl-L-homoserine lactone synthetase
MKTQFKIRLKLEGEEKTIYFGMPDNQQELDEMYRLRYRVYRTRNYIMPNDEEKDIDKYDIDGFCKYFIAQIDNRVLGSARLIIREYLPTEKDCFRFNEPELIKEIPRDKRGEIGRLIVEKYKENVFLPRHLVMTGIFSAIVSYCQEVDIMGGYSFIKDSLRKKLKKLNFPFNIIEPFEQIYNQELLKAYFNDPNDKVWPVFYIRDDVSNYLSQKIFNDKFFKKEMPGELVLKSGFRWNLSKSLFYFRNYIK